MRGSCGNGTFLPPFVLSPGAEYCGPHIPAREAPLLPLSPTTSHPPFFLTWGGSRRDDCMESPLGLSLFFFGPPHPLSPTVPHFLASETEEKIKDETTRCYLCWRQKEKKGHGITTIATKTICTFLLFHFLCVSFFFLTEPFRLRVVGRYCYFYPSLWFMLLVLLRHLFVHVFAAICGGWISLDGSTIYVLRGHLLVFLPLPLHLKSVWCTATTTRMGSKRENRKALQFWGVSSKGLPFEHCLTFSLSCHRAVVCLPLSQHLVVFFCVSLLCVFTCLTRMKKKSTQICQKTKKRFTNAKQNKKNIWGLSFLLLSRSLGFPCPFRRTSCNFKVRLAVKY